MALGELFTTKTDVFLGIVLLLFVLPLKVFFHPDHFLKQEIQMLSVILGSRLDQLVYFLRQNFDTTVSVALDYIRADFLQLSLNTFNLLSKDQNVKFFALMLNDKLFET